MGSERNIIHYVIFYSPNGKDFNEIGNVSANNTASKYQYLDRAVNGTNYYKLFQLDFDVKSTDLGIKEVSFALKQSQLTTIYTN